MNAPWGKFNPQAIEAKRIAMVRYSEGNVAFWERRKMIAPTLPSDDRTNLAVPIESWVPRLAPAFAEFANDVRRK
jgi:hypothetical protein